MIMPVWLGEPPCSGIEEGEVIKDRTIPYWCWPFVSCSEDVPFVILAL